MNPLGKRDLSSRRGEVKTSIIGTVGRVAVNSQYDLNELSIRAKKQKWNHKSKHPIISDSEIDALNSRVVACVSETEPAMYYKPNIPKDRKLVGNLGRQPFVWTAINGIRIDEIPDLSMQDFEKFPDEVKLEFIMRKLEFRGIMTTSWQQDSNLAGVTPNKMPCTREGTATMHTMYPTTIIAADTLGVTFPSNDDIKNRVNIPNKDQDKCLMAVKPMREIIAQHNLAIQKVMEEAGNIFKDAEKVAQTKASFAAAADDVKANMILSEISNINKNAAGLKKYVSTIMLKPMNQSESLERNTTTPFLVLYHAMILNNISPMVTFPPHVINFEPVKKTIKGHVGIFTAMHNRHLLLQSTRLGIALTSAKEQEPFDVLVGR